MSTPSPDHELARFIAKYAPEIRTQAEAALAKLRKLLPGAIELVYDSYNGLAVAFAASERTSEAVFSITLYPRWVSLFFTQGAKLTDPKNLLKGSGTAIRHIVLESTSTLDQPAVQALMQEALRIAGQPFDAKAPNRIVIKSISAKQRPRRPQGITE